MARRRRSICAVPAVLLVALLVALLAALPAPADAACHIAGFVESSVEVDESEGEVELTIVLQGRQPGCAGTVDYATEDGTAVAGQDYEATSGTVAFVADDDREETIVVPILADDTSDPGETFQVVLSNPQGLSGTSGPATVTITEGAGDQPTEPEPTGSPTPTVTTTDPAADGVDDEPADASTTPWVPILVVVLVLGVAAAVYAVRGRSGPPG